MQSKEQEMIRLDVNNMFYDNLPGDYGLKFSDVAGLEEQAKSADSAIRDSRPGFMELPFSQEKVVEEILEFTASRQQDYDNFVVLGIGGSALGNIALQTALNPPYYNESESLREGKPRLYVPDNVDPVRFAALLENIELENTLFNVISKSGTTAETMSLYLIARQKVAEAVGEENVAEHFVATTSSDSGYLLKIARQEGFPCFHIPEDVGGRFSVLTPVGLLSAAFCGIDIEKLLQGAADMAQKCKAEDIWKNPAYLHGVLQYLAYQQGRKMSVMMPYSHLLKDVADWYRQLWAESLGKEENRAGEKVNVGPTPIKALGATDQHSQMQLYMEGPRDKIINFLEVENQEADMEIPAKYPELEGVNYLGGHTLSELLNTEKQASELALTRRGRLNCTIIMPEVNAHTLGQLFYLLELETAFVGELFNINAFNQPGVELGKHYTYGVMGRKGYEDKREEFFQRPESDEDLII